MGKKTFLLPAAIVALAGVLSFSGLSSNNLWWDEIANTIFARQDLSGLSFNSVLVVPHAPLYYQLLHFAARVGENEFVLRFISAVFGTLSVAFFYLFAREAAGSAAALLGSLLLAVSPLRIWYSQEVTPHMMAFCLSLAALYNFHVFVRRPGTAPFVLWTLFNTLSFYTTNHSLLLLPAQAIFLLLSGREISPRVWKLCALGISVQAVLYLPQIFNLMHALVFLLSGFWIPSLSLGSPAYTVINFFLGYNGDFFLSLAVLAVFCAALGRILSGHVRKDIARVFLAFGLFPLLVIATIHSFFIRVYIDRHNMLFLPAFFVAVSAGLLSFRSRAVRLGAASVLLAAAAASAVNYYRDIMPLPAPSFGHDGVYVKRNVTDVLEYLRAHAKPGDAVANSSPGLMGLLQYYAPKDMRFYYFCAQHDAYWTRRMDTFRSSAGEQAIDTDWGTLMYLDTPGTAAEALRLLPSRVWLLQSSWSRDGRLESNGRRAAEIISSLYAQSGEEWVQGVRITLWTLRGGDGKEP